MLLLVSAVQKSFGHSTFLIHSGTINGRFIVPVAVLSDIESDRNVIIESLHHLDGFKYSQRP